MRSFLNLIAIVSLLIISSCTQEKESDATGDILFEGFVNPPAEARPFVRWWWNGNHITAEEILRQLDVLHDAGIGGVEINPIAMPEEAEDIGTSPLVWLSSEWNEMLVLAAKEAQERDMISDLIVGSGWPFGGEFVQEDETIQRVMSHKLNVSGGEIISEDKESLYKMLRESLDMRVLRYQSKSYEIHFIRLVPRNIKTSSEIIDLTGNYMEKGRLEFEVPTGDYQLIYGILEKSVREVMHGAPGAAGPVMDHYKRDITIAYLNRLKKISEDTGIPLDQLIRALFCDSIELAGSNWTDGFEEIFFQNYNYSPEPYLPFIFYNPYDGYQDNDFPGEFNDTIERVRYDYNNLLVKVFNDNFTRVFQDFCTENNLLCRYQAYGTPLLMGIMEGNLIPDIPESNNWIYSASMTSDEWQWNQGHGYMIWNVYASSAAHLMGRQIISNESMTNTRGVFKTSLDEIKQHDDMNFITGMNHAVLHGYNYSPTEAGFPGWVRYGSYFSEQNTWWPYFSKWVDYNARLSWVFQQSSPVKKIAVLAPTGDIWTRKGLTREPFHTEPWYCHRLWEPISQAGSSCDYINEEIIHEATTSDGKLRFGPMSYQAVILSNIRSLHPETALSLLDYVRNGGKIVVIDSTPYRSLSLTDSPEGDNTVKNSFADMVQSHPENIIFLDGPNSENDLLPWTMDMLSRLSIESDAEIKKPDPNVFQIRKKSGERDIYFFTNSNRSKTASLEIKFPTENKIPWIWNPEDGTRRPFPSGENNSELKIELNQLESLLLVFEPDDMEYNKEAEASYNKAGPGIKPGNQAVLLKGPWNVKFDHIDGNDFERIFENLYNFGISDDRALNTFAGTVIYNLTFESDGNGQWLELEEVNKGVTEVYLNGSRIGLNWYGRPVFPVKDVLVKGENHIEIKYTTVLSNYAMSLTGNPTAERWTRGYEKIPVGLEGVVRIFGD